MLLSFMLDYSIAKEQCRDVAGVFIVVAVAGNFSFTP